MQGSFTNNFKQYFKPQENANLLASITIDWFPQDPDKEGKVVAKVKLTRQGEIVVDWRESKYKENKTVLDLIKESQKELLEEYPVLKAKAAKIKVQAIWEFEVDAEDFDPKFVDVEGLAIDLTKAEFEDLLEKKELSAEDFEYKIIE